MSVEDPLYDKPKLSTDSNGLAELPSFPSPIQSRKSSLNNQKKLPTVIRKVQRLSQTHLVSPNGAINALEGTSDLKNCSRTKDGQINLEGQEDTLAMFRNRQTKRLISWLSTMESNLSSLEFQRGMSSLIQRPKRPPINKSRRE
jgi:hypothetical protein